MIRLSACIEMMFGEHGYYDRFKAAKDCDVPGVEFWDWTGKDLEKCKQAVEETGVVLTGFCVGSREPVEGNKPIVYEDTVKAFPKHVADSIKAAKYVGATNLIITTGQERQDVPRIDQHRNIVNALKSAAQLCEEAGITLVLEPLNILINHKGYYLSTSKEGFEIIDEVNSPNVKLLFDIYHQQITEGNVINNIVNNIDLIGHFHIADNPGRNQPGTGEMNYRNILKAIDKTDYKGWIGMEYSPTVPTADTVASLYRRLRDRT